MAKKKSTKTASSKYGNYSKLIVSKLKELKINPGDKILIQSKNKKVEGNLLSQSDVGDPESILVKLENGYNIGIKVDSDFELTPLEGKVDLEKFNIRVPKQKKGLPSISLLSTGGTIASRIDYQTGGVVMAMEPEEIFASLPELFNEVSFTGVKSLFTMASEDFSPNEWKIMAENAANELNNGAKGVVLSHGTDTMGYSAAALSFMLQDINAPVVFTGAQRSSDRGSFDGAFNLISASRIAANSDIASVLVVMHETSDDNYCQVSRGTRVRKMHTTRRDAFKTINDLPLARISYEGVISETSDDIPRRHNRDITPLLGFEEKVGLIKVYPGMTSDIIDHYVDNSYRGLIIEGTGLGHVPTFPQNKKNNIMEPLIRAIEEGIFVGMTSQCLNGRVHPYVYRATRTGSLAGIVYLEDMIPETAYIKLGWVLGNFEENEYENKMLHNFAGELSDRSYFKEYDLK